MERDFGAGYKNFCEASEVWKKVKLFLDKDSQIKSLPVRSNAFVHAVAQTAFETVVIFRGLAPNQALEVAKLPLLNQMHQLHSERAKKLAENYVAKRSRYGVEGCDDLAIIYVVAELRREPEASELSKELARWDEHIIISKATAGGARRAAPRL